MSEWRDWRDVPRECVPLVVFELAQLVARRAFRDVEEAASEIERARVRYEEMQERHKRKLAVYSRWAALAVEAGREAVRFAESRSRERKAAAWKEEERVRLDEGHAAQGAA